jgi:Bacterial Ig-like domain (group 2)
MSWSSSLPTPPSSPTPLCAGFARPRLSWTVLLLAGCVTSTGIGDESDRWLEVRLEGPGQVTASIDTSAAIRLEAYDIHGDRVAVGLAQWASSNPEILTVEPSSGEVRVHAAGAVTVTATAGDRGGAAVVVVDLPSDVASLELIPRDAGIEGLVLGQGPLAAESQWYSCSYPGRWASFPRGTEVVVRVSTAVALESREAIRRGLEDLPAATGGSLHGRFILTEAADPLPRDNEVSVAIHDDPMALGCRTGSGCTLHRFAGTGVLAASRVVMPRVQTPNAFVHDAIGHGILGMCHVDADRIGGAQHSLMSGGDGVYSNQTAAVLSELDRELQRAVWSSDLNPGAGIREFRGMGLTRR